MDEWKFSGFPLGAIDFSVRTVRTRIPLRGGAAATILEVWMLLVDVRKSNLHKSFAGHRGGRAGEEINFPHRDNSITLVIGRSFIRMVRSGSLFFDLSPPIA